MWKTFFFIQQPANLQRKIPLNSYESIKMIYKGINWEWKLQHYDVAAAESQLKVNLVLNLQHSCSCARGERKLYEGRSNLSYNNRSELISFHQMIPHFLFFFLTGCSSCFLRRLLRSDRVLCCGWELTDSSNLMQRAIEEATGRATSSLSSPCQPLLSITAAIYSWRRIDCMRNMNPLHLFHSHTHK